MKISILFASFNGANRLPTMLSSFEKLNTSHSMFEIIAVDNNSTDETRSVLSSFTDSLPITVLSEKEKGKSHALNTALDSLSEDTDIVILTDDDIVPDEEWLNRMVAAFETNPSYGMFAGSIKPHWEKSPPEWILKWVNLSMVFAINEHTQNGEINPDMVFGPNSAFRAKIFLQDGVRIPTHIGPKAGGRYPMGNDSALARKIANLGYKAYQVSDAVVGHMIPAKNMDMDWIVARAERFGWGLVVQHPEWFEKFKGLSLFAIKKRLKFWLYIPSFYIAKYLMPHCHRRFKTMYWYYYQKGVFTGVDSDI